MLPNLSSRGSNDRHKNACLTLKGRKEMVRAVADGAFSKAAAVRKYNTTSTTVAKWVGPFRADGADGLHDRSSGPLSLPRSAYINGAMRPVSHCL
jgi:leucine-zipper of insertion element IS481